MVNLVSAVITTHNRKALLERAIKSVLSQTYQSIELIVVDDASDDGTKELCQLYTLNYIFISKEESRGGNYARNLGIKASNGKYVAFLDDDDYWIPSKIEKQVRLIEEKGCELVYCSRIIENVNGSEVNHTEHLIPQNYPVDLHKEILFGVCTVTSCIMAKRYSLFDVGLFDEQLKFWQEYDLSIRLAQRGPFYYINEPLVVYRLDIGDKQRLTNKFYAWRKAVNYLYGKHKELYSQLTFREKIKARMFYWGDAINRSHANNLQIEYLKYKIISKIAFTYLSVVK